MSGNGIPGAIPRVCLISGRQDKDAGHVNALWEMSEKNY